LTHRFSYEFAFDGGVIEFTTDNGQTWQDVAEISDIDYTRPLVAGSPLAGRSAFTGNSQGFPETSELVLSFGTQLAGKTFKLRFRIGSDGGVGAPGWEIDNAVFSGLEGTPFPTLVADTAKCKGRPGPGPGPRPRPRSTPNHGDGPDADSDGGHDGGGCRVGGGLGAGNAGALLLVLAVLLHRRRR
jgi:hypothetical protein